MPCVHIKKKHNVTVETDNDKLLDSHPDRLNATVWVTMMGGRQEKPGCIFFNSWLCALWFNVNKKVQLDATVCRHLFTAQSLYMFRASQHPSSGVLKTVTATSGIGHNVGTATSFQRGLIKASCSLDQATLEGSRHTNIMTYTRGSGYSF